MKKFLSLLMVLSLMLVPVASLAEADDYEVYLSPDESYGFAYPAEWVLISREVIEQALEDGYTAGDGGLGDLMALLKPQMEQMDMVMLMNLYTNDNINMVCQDLGSPMTDEQLLENMQSVKELWKQLDPNAEFLSEPELIELGEDNRTYALVAYQTTDTSGTPISAMQAITCEGTTQYTFTLTMYSTEEDAAYEAIETMEIMLTTFTTM